VINFGNSPSVSTTEDDYSHYETFRGPRHINKVIVFYFEIFSSKSNIGECFQAPFVNRLTGNIEPKPKLYYGFTPMMGDKDLPELPGPTERPLEDFLIPDIGQHLKSFYQPVWKEKQAEPKFQPVFQQTGLNVDSASGFDRSKRNPSSLRIPDVKEQVPHQPLSFSYGQLQHPKGHKSTIPHSTNGEFNKYYR